MAARPEGWELASRFSVDIWCSLLSRAAWEAEIVFQGRLVGKDCRDQTVRDLTQWLICGVDLPCLLFAGSWGKHALYDRRRSSQATVGRFCNAGVRRTPLDDLGARGAKGVVETPATDGVGAVQHS